MLIGIFDLLVAFFFIFGQIGPMSENVPKTGMIILEGLDRSWGGVLPESPKINITLVQSRSPIQSNRIKSDPIRSDPEL